MKTAWKVAKVAIFILFSVVLAFSFALNIETADRAEMMARDLSKYIKATHQLVERTDALISAGKPTIELLWEYGERLKDLEEIMLQGFDVAEEAGT